MATKKGRPTHNNNIIIHDINVEYLSTNTDKLYNSTILTVKLTDPKPKLKPVIDTQANDNDVTLSCIWTTDTQDVILKVKETQVNVADDLQPLSNYVVNLDFSAHSLDTDNGNMKGYYAKVIKIKNKK